MPKTISASEAKTKLGSVMDWAVDNNESVIIESRGQPKVAVVPIAEYEQYKVLREQERRRAALAKLEELAATIQSRNQDLSLEEADNIANQFTKEVVQEMIDEGQVKYQKS